MSKDLQAYLAAKYMSGPKAEAILSGKNHRASTKAGKKKKTKASQLDPAASSGLILRDDEEERRLERDHDDDVEGEPVVETLPTFQAKKPTESKWETIKRADDVGRGGVDGGEEEAEDEKPQVVAMGGLTTGAAIQATYAAKRRPAAPPPGADAAEPETVYRDASGRKIDTKQMRAEEKRRQARELEAKIKKMEWGKGLVQRQDRRAQADELAKIAAQPFARTIDDKQLNDELKSQQRWNDPAAAFLTKSTGPSARSQRPTYSGPPPPPNRYGITPGFRWDGVDRSNGFEKKIFQTSNDQKRLRAEAYNYSVDEM